MGHHGSGQEVEVEIMMTTSTRMIRTDRLSCFMPVASRNGPVSAKFPLFHG